MTKVDYLWNDYDEGCNKTPEERIADRKKNRAIRGGRRWGRGFMRMYKSLEELSEELYWDTDFSEDVMPDTIKDDTITTDGLLETIEELERKVEAQDYREYLERECSYEINDRILIVNGEDAKVIVSLDTDTAYLDVEGNKTSIKLNKLMWNMADVSRQYDRYDTMWVSNDWMMNIIAEFLIHNINRDG